MDKEMPAPAFRHAENRHPQKSQGNLLGIRRELGSRGARRRRFVFWRGRTSVLFPPVKSPRTWKKRGAMPTRVVPDEAEAVDAVCHASSGCEGTSVGGLPHPGRIPLQRTTSANATRELRLRIASPRFQLFLLILSNNIAIYLNKVKTFLAIKRRMWANVHQMCVRLNGDKPLGVSGRVRRGDASCTIAVNWVYW